MNNTIHQFRFQELNIVLDINSGCVHVVDELTYRILEIYDGTNEQQVESLLSSAFPVNELREAMGELQELKEQGKLFSEPVPVPPIFEQPPVIKSLCLHIAHDCNLRCNYCFAGTGEYHGGRSLMSAEVGKRAVDLLVAHSGQRKHCEMDYFGGEPLMNMDVLKEITAYARSRETDSGKKFRITMTTNAVLLDQDKRQYFNDNDIQVVLSLDGRKQVHDRMRPFAGGCGSYDVVEPNITAMTQSRPHGNYYVRGTYTHHNLDFAQDVLHLADLGYREISIEPVVCADGSDYALCEEDLPMIAQQYELLAQEYWQRHEQGKGFRYYHFNVDIEHGPCLPRRLEGCGAGHEYFAVSPQGDLYPCHQFVGQEQFKVGDVFQGIQNMDMVWQFRRNHIFNKQDCPQCWARFYCSGGCHANAWSFNQDLKQPYQLGCKLQRKRLEAALYVQAKHRLQQLAAAAIR